MPREMYAVSVEWANYFEFNVTKDGIDAAIQEERDHCESNKLIGPIVVIRQSDERCIDVIECDYSEPEENFDDFDTQIQCEELREC